MEGRSFLEDKSHNGGWLWYKNMNIPSLKFKYSSCSSNEDRLIALKVLAVRNDEDNQWREVAMKGTESCSF